MTTSTAHKVLFFRVSIIMAAAFRRLLAYFPFTLFGRVAVVCFALYAQCAASGGGALPMKQWHSEIGVRYWYSEGETAWNHNPSLADPELGNPGSILTYRDMNAQTMEVFFRADHRSGVFVKGFVGAGGVLGGSLDDEDYEAGQIKFSDTFSALHDGNLRYIDLDLGMTLYENRQSHGHLNRNRVGLFVGYLYWNEQVHGFGIRCNPDDIGGVFCGPPGSLPIPFSTNVITNSVQWNALRLGLAADADLTPKINLNAEIAYLPWAALNNQDSHYLREEFAPPPNLFMNGKGDGWMAEAAANYQITKQFRIGFGGRYWRLKSDGSILFAGLDTGPMPLNEFYSRRYGAFIQGSLRFV